MLNKTTLPSLSNSFNAALAISFPVEIVPSLAWVNTERAASVACRFSIDLLGELD